MGKAKGAGWADVQYLPGGGRDTQPDAARRAAQMIELIDTDGLYRVVDTPSWLSGEWADEPTVRDIAEACGIDEERDEDGESMEECADVYCLAADEAFEAAIVRHLRSVAGKVTP